MERTVKIGSTEQGFGWLCMSSMSLPKCPNTESQIMKLKLIPLY